MRNLIICLIAVCIVVFSSCRKETNYAVVISANSEWKVVKEVYPNEKYVKSTYGEYFFKIVNNENILFFHEGWGKVSAAGGTQYVIDTFNPDIIINIGTCGGFEGEVQRFDIMLAEKTVIYDIVEAMGDSKEAITDYSTDIDLSWLKGDYPTKVRKITLVSADKDLRVDEIEKLKNEYSAVAGDWESGAIAYVAKKNNKKVIILRGISDVVSSKGGEAYGNLDLFIQRTDTVIRSLLEDLPKWIEFIDKNKSSRIQ